MPIGGCGSGAPQSGGEELLLVGSVIIPFPEIRPQIVAFEIRVDILDEERLHLRHFANGQPATVVNGGEQRNRSGEQVIEVAAIRVVLDEHERATWSEVRPHESQDRDLVLHEVQRVRHEHPVHAVEAERPDEVSGPLVEADRRVPRLDELRLPGERTAVRVDGMDGAGGPQQLGEGEGERAGPRSELEPGPTRCNRIADERDVIAMLYVALPERVRFSA